MKRAVLLATCVFPAVLLANPACAQDLQTRPVTPPPPSSTPSASDDQVQFTATNLEYDSKEDIVTATGDVRMYRSGDRLRADLLDAAADLIAGATRPWHHTNQSP